MYVLYTCYYLFFFCSFNVIKWLNVSGNWFSSLFDTNKHTHTQLSVQTSYETDLSAKHLITFLIALQLSRFMSFRRIYMKNLCLYLLVAVHFFVALKILLLHKMELKLQMPLLQEHDLNGMFFWKSFASLKTTKQYTIQNYFIGNSILHVWNSNDG